MMYVMRRRKPEPTLLLTQGIFNLPRNLGMVWEELAFDDHASYLYTAGKWTTLVCWIENEMSMESLCIATFYCFWGPVPVWL